MKTSKITTYLVQEILHHLWRFWLDRRHKRRKTVGYSFLNLIKTKPCGHQICLPTNFIITKYIVVTIAVTTVIYIFSLTCWDGVDKAFKSLPTIGLTCKTSSQNFSVSEDIQLNRNTRYQTGWFLHEGLTLGSSLSKCRAKQPIKMITDWRIVSWAEVSGAMSRNCSNTGNRSDMLAWKINIKWYIIKIKQAKLNATLLAVQLFFKTIRG